MRKRTAARIWAAIVLAALAAGAIGTAWAGDESEAEKAAAEEAVAAAADKTRLAGDIAAAFEESRVQLEQLCYWCTGFELMVQRARIAELLLMFQPDHEKARDWLGHKKQKNGTWKAAPVRPLADVRTDALPEFEKRRAAIAASFRQRFAPILERCTDWSSASARDRIVRALVTLLPDDAALRAMHGEVLAGGKWILRESAETAANRDRIAAAVSAVRSAARSLTPAADPRTWKCVIATDEILISSLLTASETRGIASDVLAGAALFNSVLGLNGSFGEGAQLYLLPDVEANARFAAGLTVGDAQQKKTWARLGSYWFRTGSCVVALRDVADRRDCAVRQFIANQQGDFEQLAHAPPWLCEGVGTYLTFRLLGTRLTAFVAPGSEYSDQGVSRDVASVDADWVQVARKLVDKGFALDVPMLTGLPLNSITKDDGLIAYALAAYFVEGRPKDLASFLRALHAKDVSQHRAMAEVLGIDAEGLQYRFVRWLREIPAK